MNDDFDKLVNVLRDYFDLLYHGDTDIIKKIFTPEATVNSVSDGIITSINMDGFHDRITARKSPKSIGEKRYDKIKFIDISSPTTAMAKVECVILNNNYTDYLSFIKVREKWLIISKVFHMNSD